MPCASSKEVRACAVGLDESESKMAEEEVPNIILQRSAEVFNLAATQLRSMRDKYKEFILKNPETASKVESVLRALSYILPGRFGASEALSELVSSAAHLLTLMHDGIYRGGVGTRDCEDSPERGRIVLWLTVMEYLEVFIELGAEHLWGEIGKWVVVIVVQIAKAALRFLLLFKYKSGVQPTPLIPPMDRSTVLDKSGPGAECVVNETGEPLEEKAGPSEQGPLWHGARSGRRIRSLSAAPPDAFRSWKLPPEEEPQETNEPCTPTALSARRLFAESLYISRPLLHLSSMFLFGQKAWKPWLLSCSVDVTSLALMGDPGDLNHMEKSEVSRRTILLLFYFLRSPFYDTYSKARILSFLGFLNCTVPGISLVLTPLLEYLPTWQKIYFYNWTS